MKKYLIIILGIFLFAPEAFALGTPQVSPVEQAKTDNANPKFKSVQQKNTVEQEKKDLAAMRSGVQVDDIYVACKYYFSKLFNTRENVSRKNICNGYFFGSASMILLLQDEGVDTNTCIPMDISTEEVIKLFLKWAEANPDKNKMLASQALLLLIRQNYPCNEYKPQKNKPQAAPPPK